MFGSLFFGLTVLTYIALIILNFQNLSVRGENLVGWGLMAFIVLCAYVVCSLILTINITSTGGFNWLSKFVSTPKIAVGLLWLGLVSGVIICTGMRAEWHSESSTGLVRWLVTPLYFGATWLPLLMLLPYVILLNPEWRETLSPYLYKIPLVLGSVIGPGIYLVSIMISGPAKHEPMDSSKLSYERSIEIINSYPDPQIWKFTSQNMDERVRKLALEKIKANENWESDMRQEMEGNNQYLGVYAYLDGNNLDHPEQFVEPIIQNISHFAYQIREAISPNYSEPDEEFLKHLDAVRLCRVLDEHFKNNSVLFRPNMLEVQKALETEPLDRFAETRNKYRLAVKNWLDTH